MNTHTIALFGEAEKGDFETAYFCDSLNQLVDYLGHPPAQSKGLFYAIQTLLFHHRLIFFRVREEGFSREDYLLGLRLLKQKDLIAQISAIGLPGVGDVDLIREITPICLVYHSIFIMNESDLFDYLTANAD
jgi:hypothetical protein